MVTKSLTHFFDSVGAGWEFFRKTNLPVTLLFGDTMVTFRNMVGDGERFIRSSIFYAGEGWYHDYLQDIENLYTGLIVTDIYDLLKQMGFTGVFLNPGRFTNEG